MTKGKIFDEVTLLSAVNEGMRIKGKLSYSEGDQAWSVLRLKKEILQKYPYLKEKTGNFVYLLNLCNDFKELKKEIEKLQNDSEVVPMIFLIGKEKNEIEQK